MLPEQAPEPTEAPVAEVPVAQAAPTPVAVAAPAPVPAAAAGGGDGGAEVNAAPSALDAIRVILAGRFSKPVDAIDTATTIKALSGGKSAMQNEIVGDLGKPEPFMFMLPSR